MKKLNTNVFIDNIPKPPAPHKTVLASEIPTREQIEKKRNSIAKMKSLGIPVNVLDSEKSDNTVEYEQDMDELRASILIMSGKDIPLDLEKKLLEKKRIREEKGV